MYKNIKESSCEIKVPIEKKISKELPVFYNSVMKFNRDVSVLLLNSIGKKDMQIADIEIEVDQYVTDWNGANARLELGVRSNSNTNYYFYASTNILENI